MPSYSRIQTQNSGPLVGPEFLLECCRFRRCLVHGLLHPETLIVRCPWVL